MIWRSRKPVALLLALLLALLPLQGLLAAVWASPSAASVSEASHAMPEEGIQNADHNCQDCEQHQCCSQGGCDLQHCLSCATGTALPGSGLELNLAGSLPREELNSLLPEHPPTGLHRPPRG